MQQVLKEPKVDQVFSRETNRDGSKRYVVDTADRGRLEFHPVDLSSANAQDEFGGYWSFEGDLKAVDARVDEQGILCFGKYPNALERICHSFDRRYSGDLWVTARRGHEFCITGSVPDQKGSHGSLHEGDSTVPLIAAGGESGLHKELPRRTVDIAPFCLSLLGEQPQVAVGQSRNEALMDHPPV